MTSSRTTAPYRILFLCTGNSCRSQMAEGWARKLHPHRIRACSAGITASELNPLAVQVMAEAGVDISKQRSQDLAAYQDTPLDLIVTVCDHARAVCPVFPGDVRTIHRGFDDPPALATSDTDLAPYRRVRDEIKQFVTALGSMIAKGETDS